MFRFEAVFKNCSDDKVWKINGEIKVKGLWWRWMSIDGKMNFLTTQMLLCTEICLCVWVHTNMCTCGSMAFTKPGGGWGLLIRRWDFGVLHFCSRDKFAQKLQLCKSAFTGYSDDKQLLLLNITTQHRNTTNHVMWIICGCMTMDIANYCFYDLTVTQKFELDSEGF